MLDSSPSSPVNPVPSLFHSDALPIGAKLGEFEITGLLGVGGFGMVYGAFDHSLQRTVAIKEFMPSALAGRSSGDALICRSPSDQAALTAGLHSFVAEARLLAQFDHPSLVKVYRFWEANNTAYMAMPLYRGLTLKNARSQAQSPPPEPWLRALLWSILGALKYLHEHSTVHRDISPDNIFLQEVGPPVLLDLGAARRAISEKSQKHTAVLKINYAPIEQYADSSDMAQGPWTDLYALSAVVHGCLCNAPPLPAAFRVVRDRMPTIASVAQTVESIFDQTYSPEFVQALEHALQIQPQDRPQSVQAFIDEMGLTAPRGDQAVSWRDGLVSGGIFPVADSEAKTVLQVSLPLDHGVTAPATDAAPLEHISAYGVLEQDSCLLIADDVPEFVAESARQSVTEGFAAPPPVKSEDGPVGNSQINPPVKPIDPPASDPLTEKTAAAAPARSRQWVIAGVCALALVAGAGFWLSGKQTGAPRDAEPGSSTQTKEAAKEPARESANAPAVPAPPNAGVAVPTAASASAPFSGVAAAAPKASASAPAKAASAQVAGKKADPVVKPGKPELTKTQPETRPGTPRTAAEDARTPPPSPAAVPAPAPAAPPQPAPAQRARAGPAEICADRNFLVRPMCIFQECEKPEFSGLAFCIENKRQLERNNPPTGR